MRKITIIISLFVLLVGIFLLDMFIGGKLRETFKGIKEKEVKIDVVSKTNTNFLKDYSEDYMNSNDQPLFFGFK